MTKEEAYNLKAGDVVFLYGNKLKPQKILEVHVDIFNLYYFSGLVRFERGGYMNVLLEHDNIELAPKGTVPQLKNTSTFYIPVRQHKDCIFHNIEVPIDDIDRELFFIKNGIYQDEFKNYVINTKN